MLKEIIISIQAYFKAHQFIKKHKLWKWILLSGIIYTFLFVISMIFFGKTATSFIEWLTLKAGLKNWLDTMKNSFLGFLFALGGMIFWMIQMLLYFSLFKYLFLIIGSPFFSLLSEKTFNILNGVSTKFNFNQFINDIVRGVSIAIRNAGWQTIYLLAILFLGFVPILGLVTPVIAVFVECYYYGFSMLDYNMEREQKNAAESIYYIGHNKGLAIGNGMVFYILHFIPILGWVIAPSYAVIAATISLHELKNTAIDPQQ